MKLSFVIITALLAFRTVISASYAGQASSVHPYDPQRIKQASAAREDLLGEAAMKLPGGPSYEYFRDLMPPLRYTDANFKHYPIVLSSPGATAKVRLISNGSSINALSRSRSWVNETGKPVTFYVGDKREVFGSNLAHLDGPRYADGYLPIVQMRYSADGATYAMEVFASVDEELAKFGAALVKLTLVKASGQNYRPPAAEDKDQSAATAPVAGVEGAENLAVINRDFDEKIEALVEGPELFGYKNNAVSTEGKTWVMTHPRWAINAGRGALLAPMKVGESWYLAVFTKPADETLKFRLSAESYTAQRAACAKTWNDFLARGTVVETGEKVVNDAWRSTMIGTFMLLHGDEMRYSAGNQYAKLYIGEGGDTIRCNTLWGQGEDAKRMIPPQFKYTRAGLEFHQAAFKLQMLAAYFRLTRDAEFVKSIRPMWEKEINVILKGRQTENGMFPREKYAGDVDTRVFSLNSNANCWRALRDMSGLLNELGEKEQAAELSKTAEEYRRIILAALDKAIHRDVDPPFVPIALSGEEAAHVPIWASTIGSYWNLMIEYVIGSGVFRYDSQTMSDTLRYIQTHGGLCMGMLRARATPGNFWVSGGRINDLYGMRYALTLLQRDEVDRALVSFYGKLAQGMTRDTFIGCEGSSIGSLDEFGRQMALPPNSCANSNFLQQLRYILVQDYDMDDDGREETLRLAFGTPRRWLEEGKKISVKKAPTVFGMVSYELRREGNVVHVEVDMPERAPKAAKVRLRLPEGDQVMDLTGKSGHVSLTAKVVT
jgi:hypothetical protein